MRPIHLFQTWGYTVGSQAVDMLGTGVGVDIAAFLVICWLLCELPQQPEDPHLIQQGDGIAAAVGLCRPAGKLWPALSQSIRAADHGQ